VGAFVEGHDDMAIFDLDLSADIQQAVEKHLRGGMVVVFRQVPGEQTI